jgi:hypothetical protein
MRLSEPMRDECEDLLYDICGALGCIEPGYGDSDYSRAMKAVARLRVILGLDAATEGDTDAS